MITLDDFPVLGAAELTFNGWHAEAIPYVKEKIVIREAFFHVFLSNFAVVFRNISCLKVKFRFLYKLLMWDKNQKTLSNETSFSGIGLHSGEKVEVKLIPTNSNSGIIFKRTDLKKNNEIVANFKNVSSAKLCTKIENDFGTSVSTIEHLMAAFYFLWS